MRKVLNYLYPLLGWVSLAMIPGEIIPEEIKVNVEADRGCIGAGKTFPMKTRDVTVEKVEDELAKRFGVQVTLLVDCVKFTKGKFGFVFNAKYKTEEPTRISFDDSDNVSFDTNGDPFVVQGDGVQLLFEPCSALGQYGKHLANQSPHEFGRQIAAAIRNKRVTLQFPKNETISFEVSGEINAADAWNQFFLPVLTQAKHADECLALLQTLRQDLKSKLTPVQDQD